MRRCVICGKEVQDGMTDLENFYAHEKCFPAAMNKIYGKYRWMMVDEELEHGGYYAYWNGTGFEDTGIFYTEWEEEVEP